MKRDTEGVNWKGKIKSLRYCVIHHDAKVIDENLVSFSMSLKRSTFGGF